MSPFKIILSFIALAAVGFILTPSLSVQLMPSNDRPVLTISFSMRDAPPEIVEQEATAPLENVLSQVSGLKKVYSISNYASGIIELTFDKDADIVFKKFEVNSLIRDVYRKLDHAISYPVVEQQSRGDKSKSPLLVYRINARLAPYQIRKTVEDVLYTKISQIDGVNEVVIRGAEQLQLAIGYDQDRLQQYHLNVADIIKELQTRFGTFYPGAVLTGNDQRFTIKGGNTPRDLTDIENIRMRSAGGTTIPLKKVASVYWEERKPVSLFRINGLNSVTMTFLADENVNRLKVAERIKEELARLSSSLPQGFTLVADYDDTEFLRREIDKNLFRSLLSFVILLVFLAVSYRRLAHLGILFSGILISLGVTALAAYVLKIPIHLYTIAGITVSLGIIIDNSIVVLDHLRTRKDTKVTRAVIAAALTTIMALLLVLLLPDEDRQNLTDFSIIVSVAIGCSVLTAVIFTPSAAARSRAIDYTELSFKQMRMRARWFMRYDYFTQLLLRYRKTFVALCILTFGLPIFLLPARWEGHEFYNNTVGSEVYQEKIRPVADPLLGGALRYFVRNVYERSGYREPERTQLFVQAELPPGNTLDEMNRVMLGVEDYLSSFDGVERYMTHVISGQQARISITFDKDRENSSLPFMLKTRLIARSLDWSGVHWNIYGIGQGFSNAGGESIPSFNVVMKGYNYEALAGYADILAKKLLAHKRIQKVNTNERLSWNEKNAEHLTLGFWHTANTNPSLVSQLYARSENGHPSIFLTVKDEQFPVQVKPARNPVLSTYDLMTMPLVTADSQRVTLSSMAEMWKEKLPNAIHKEDRQYLRVVGFEYYGSYQFGQEYLNEVLAELENEMLPGYSARKNTYRWDWEKVRHQYGLIVLLAIGVYFIASILFENLKQPFFIVLTIPLSFVGLFVTFAFFDLYFDQGGYAAFILLGGLVVNACLYIVNDLNNFRTRNYNRAVLKAMTGKLRPVLLTVSSTCLGLLPFLIGGQNEVFWFALAAGTTGGLTFSLFVVFVCLPVMLQKRVIF